ncbi:MAG: hypothetical protein OEU54_16085 [Gemmatimonadota bacterium]|nr:hypothetical protein [Gemmatimonadota bacterium]
MGSTGRGGGFGRERGRSRSGGSGPLLVALAVLALATPLTAQPVVGIGLTRISNAPQALFDVDDCPGANAWSGEGVLGLRFSRIVSVETTTAYNWSNTNTCIVGPPTVPPTGEFSFSTFETPGGYPFVSSDARLVFESPDPRSSFWLRAFGGYGVMWPKSIGYWLAGGGLVFGGQLQTIIEAEWNWFSVPFDQTTLSFVDGALVSTDVTSGSRSHSMFRLRAGFRLSP